MIKLTYKQTIPCALFLVLASACGNTPNEDRPPIIFADFGTDQGMDMGKDMKTQEDMEEDIPVFGDLGRDDGTDLRRQQVIKEWPLHDKKAATGAITIMEENGVTTATIDAAAGGFNAYRSNPFVYLDLDTGKQIDVTDIEALTELTWDLSFKRSAIRTNSGDSGDGQAELALVSNTTFEMVTQAPTDQNQYAVDKTLDDNNALRQDPIGTPYTAFNELNVLNKTGSESWYNYNMGVSPIEGDIYFVKNAEGTTTYKFEIQAWKSGVYTVRWSKIQ